MSDLPDFNPSLRLYLTQMSQFPLLSRHEEFELAVCFSEQKAIEAAHKLITANLRFVVKVALESTSYGLELSNLIKQGNIDLMTALNRFDPLSLEPGVLSKSAPHKDKGSFSIVSGKLRARPGWLNQTKTM